MEKYIIDPDNVEQLKAFDLIAHTNTSLFITGEAGSGKTTFVKGIQEIISKNFLVVAQTGVAAMVAGGRTINSTFIFPPEILGLDTKLDFRPELVEEMRRIDTIIIDEVSMVRADVIDAIDRWLRIAFYSRLPFAGKQMIFVGDLYQLPPVVQRGSADSEMLRDMYGEGRPFFYKANVLKRMNLPKIQFTKVYRQKNAEFVRVLNNIRIGKASNSDLSILNKHVKQGVENGEDFGVILTAVNQTAEKLNGDRLNAIGSEEFCYEGIVEGKFDPADCAIPHQLKLKVGAQVIFCRNDRSNAHRFVNGTIAKVVSLTNDSIAVELENGLSFEVEQEVWESKKKVYDKEEKKMVSEIVGRYTQYPIKLAWAITIHKSQGMSLSKMVLDLSRGVFESGQIYVALSRVRSLEGLSITNPVLPHHISNNPEVSAFASSFNDTEMIDDEIKIGKDIASHLSTNDYDKAALACMRIIKEKIRCNDLRNAALLAKRMYDILLSDECLMESCSDMEVLKGNGMVHLFLNAIICLYSGKNEEAIVFADQVLQRRVCFEALFIKARGLYALGRYQETDDINCEIIRQFNESKDECWDKKYLLLIALVNKKIGDTNLSVCRQLIKICPECSTAYLCFRDDMLKEGKSLGVPEDKSSDLIREFSNSETSNEDLVKLFESTHKDEMKKLTNAILNFKC